MYLILLDKKDSRTMRQWTIGQWTIGQYPDKKSVDNLKVTYIGGLWYIKSNFED